MRYVRCCIATKLQVDDCPRDRRRAGIIPAMALKPRRCIRENIKQINTFRPRRIVCTTVESVYGFV
jgi:hypothetical protein